MIAELEAKSDDSNTQEVRDLQPLFDRGLWIFGQNSKVWNLHQTGGCRPY